jgi:hypothetical protein
MKKVFGVVALVAAMTSPAGVALVTTQGPAQPPDAALSSDQALVNRYCTTCHSTRMKAGDLVLAGVDVAAVQDNPELWEKVVRKLRNGLMPPAGSPRPDDATYQRFLAKLQGDLDTAAARKPNPGHTEIVHRLNRIEYRNSIRDLLGVEVDVADLLPADDSSYGFDNIAGVLKMSPALVERYLAAARVISRTAVGSPPASAAASIYRVSPEVQQHDRDDRLPLGTRGGTLVRHIFPVDAEYEIKVDLAGGPGGGGDRPQLEITIDGVQVSVAPLGRDEPEIRVPVTAGAHDVVVTFFRVPPDLVEQVREPFENPAAPSGTGGIAGRLPSLSAVTIIGPHNAKGPGDTASRRRLFTCTPANASQEAACARTILTTLTRRAYRGLSAREDVNELMKFYESGRAEGKFDDGIELALRRLLVSPEFLYRVEGTDGRSAGLQAGRGGVRRLTPHELASRLSFFLWSSIPDDQLLDLADRGTLGNPGCSTRSAAHAGRPSRRNADHQFRVAVAADSQPRDRPPRRNFALNWDETLRRSMQRETELFVDSIVRENRPAIEMLTADHVPQRAAGAPLRDGRRAGRPLPPRRAAGRQPAPGPARAGQHPDGHVARDRTSPVIRGKWIPQYDPRRAAARSAAQRAGAVRAADADPRADDARADGAASEQPDVRGVPHDDRSGGFRAGELRRDRQVPDRRRIVQSDRRQRRAAGRPEVRRRRGAAFGAGGAAGAVREHADREAADLCAGPRPRVLRHAGGPEDSRGRGA